MKPLTVTKALTANDVGTTGSHQAGIAVPKQRELLEFFPTLDASVKNPDAWIFCQDPDGQVWKLRFIYYNNKLHDPEGTRNEYRLTHLTLFLKQNKAQVGDVVRFTTTEEPNRYLISLDHPGEVEKRERVDPDVIRLRGWRRVH